MSIDYLKTVETKEANLKDYETEWTIICEGFQHTPLPYQSRRIIIGNGKLLSRPISAIEELRKFTEDRVPSLILMVTQGHQGFFDALRGSTTKQVLRKAPRPILSIPAE